MTPSASILPPPAPADGALLVRRLQQQLQRTGDLATGAAADWYTLLRVFLGSRDFADIVTGLQALVADGLRFTPPLRQVFAPFTTCPLSQLRVVVVARGPHAQLGIADGLALSATQPGACPAELNRVLNAIQQEFEQTVPGSPSLLRWAGQGVLLLNQSLTTQLDRDARHTDLWNPFFAYLLDRLALTRPSVPWVFYEVRATQIALPTTELAHVQFATTPQELARALALVNEELCAQQQEPIRW